MMPATMTVTGPGEADTDTATQTIDLPVTLTHECGYTGPAIASDTGYGVLRTECPSCWTEIEVTDR